MDIMVEGKKATQVAHMLLEKRVPYSIAMPDVNALYEQERKANIYMKAATDVCYPPMPPHCPRPPRSPSPCSTPQPPRCATPPICPPPPCIPRTCSPPPCSPPPCRKVPKMDWKCYHRLDSIYDFMDTLTIDCPGICSTSCIGTTAEGRGIKMLIISNGNKGNQAVWVDGGIHGREWISVAAATYIADQIARNFCAFPHYVTDKDWYIVPVANPDGYEYTHTHDRMWRKNRKPFGPCVGVDLNRNFSCGFGNKGEEGSSEDPGSIFYRGPSAFSESETTAIKKAIKDSKKKFKAFLSLHSYGESILFPWGHIGEPCPDYVVLLEGGTAIAKGMHEVSGHNYKVGSTKDLMYYAAGTCIDWSYGVAKIPYSYMIELRGKKHRFLMPCEMILTTATETLNGVVGLMSFICSNTCQGHEACCCPK